MDILDESRMMLELAISSLQRAGHDTEQFERTVAKMKQAKVNVTLGNVSVSYLLELMTIHLETREELNHANNSTDTYIDGKVDLANAILKLVDVNSR
jgi:hypothetical protein